MNYVTLILGLLDLAMKLSHVQQKVEQGGTATEEDLKLLRIASELELRRTAMLTGHEGELDNGNG